MAQAQFDVRPLEARVLAKAVLRSAEALGLSQVELSRVLGLSESSVSRLKSEEYVLKSSAKEWELAALLVRLYRGLDAITAGDNQSLRAWMMNCNTALAGKPSELVTSIVGLTRTVDYVDSFRARV